MIIICGLPGTGKTTLCKKIERELNYKYVSDWDIFRENDVKIYNFQDKLEISKNYSNLIFNYIMNHKDEQLVIDLEYSVSPADFNLWNISKWVKIFYLGFIELSESILIELFSKSLANKNTDEFQLKKQIKFYKKMSEIFHNQCKANSIKFVDINRNREEIIYNIILEIKADL